MKKSDLNLFLGRVRAQARGERPAGGGLTTGVADMTVRLLRIIDAAGVHEIQSAAQPDALSEVPAVPDKFTAYCDFQICHSLPQIIGPTGSGAFIGFAPQVLAQNYQGLLHKWMNLNHRVRIDNAQQDDRIVGCVVATSFPPTPPMGWGMPRKAEDAPYITARACLFKQAAGMDRVLGKQQTSRQDWKVSIEVDADLDNIGLYDPTTQEIYDWAEAPGYLIDALSIHPETGRMAIGRVNGQQAAFAYGSRRGPVDFRGVGMTTNPAEKTAKITSITAEKGGIWQIAAEAPREQLLKGRRCAWDNGRHSGTVAEVKREGFFIHPRHGFRLEASEDDPAVKIYLADYEVVLKRFSALKF